MSSEEARQIVENGLEQKKAQRLKMAEDLESQARQLRMTISGNHAEKTMTEIQKKARAEEEARRRKAERAKAREARAYRDMKAEDAVNRYGIVCLLILLVSAITRLDIFVMMALVLGLAVFPIAYIYRLYNPIQRKNNDRVQR